MVHLFVSEECIDHLKFAASLIFFKFYFISLWLYVLYASI